MRRPAASGGATLARIVCPSESRSALLPGNTSALVTIVMTSPRAVIANFTADGCRPWAFSEAWIALRIAVKSDTSCWTSCAV